ncbi:hypothetical protein GJ744_006097 [Endocarpon pusillum]|uniref:Uncharacterized protein n=1 Tax=Endocarpon pusillum TaxID=364733 RepID=A0A8H7E8G4_9EURO|nr:hypothetical protein GJ744_006097 [Endocarpon pusillum]
MTVPNQDCDLAQGARGSLCCKVGWLSRQATMHQLWRENKDQAQKSMVTDKVSVPVVGYAAEEVWAGQEREESRKFRLCFELSDAVEARFVTDPVSCIWRPNQQQC